MSITKETKSKVVENYRGSDNDTGSPSVQCAILTTRINNLTSHFKAHPKDKHSRRGLIGMVEKRRKLLKYIREGSDEQYKQLISKLQIRK